MGGAKNFFPDWVKIIPAPPEVASDKIAAHVGMKMLILRDHM